jgi:hypothetical protein
VVDDHSAVPSVWGCSVGILNAETVVPPIAVSELPLTAISAPIPSYSKIDLSP